MTTNEVQDTLLSDKELEVKIIRDALHMHKLWFKDGRIMPRYLSKLEALLRKYDDKETTILTKYNLSGDIYDTSGND
jgi:hypothetical protein|tara:strand:- start:194 stop:424 length:231 start_codon:yes stop_codon:yes gene_type:complete